MSDIREISDVREMSGVKGRTAKVIVGEIVEDLLGQVVREGKGRTPVEKAVQGAAEIRGKLVTRAKEGKGGKASGRRGEHMKFTIPEGKFEEKVHKGYGRGRGKEVCSVCYGTCCGAVRDMVARLIDIDELRPDVKVREN